MARRRRRPTLRRRRRRARRRNAWFNNAPGHRKAARLGWRRRRRPARKRRRNPVRRRRVYARRRRSYARRRRNPALRMPAFRRMFGGPALMKAGSMLIGFVGGFALPPMLIQQLPITNASTRMWVDRLKGIAVVILGSMVNMRGRRALTKDIGTGLVLAGFYDLLAMNVPQLPLPTITPKPLLPGSGEAATTGAGFAPGQQADIVGAGVSNYADADVVGADLDLDDIV